MLEENTPSTRKKEDSPGCQNHSDRKSKEKRNSIELNKERFASNIDVLFRDEK